MKKPQSHIFTPILSLLFGLLLLCTAIPANAQSSYRAPGDFDGDGKTDFAIYRPSNGQWWVWLNGTGTYFAVQFGTATDRPVPGDYTGDGKCDIAVWRPSTGEWFVLRSEDSSYYSVPFGLETDVPVQADYDGDGKTDFAVWRPSSATWYIQKTTGGYEIVPFGISTDKPAPADYDGDGKADISVSRATTWWMRLSHNNSVWAVEFTNYSASPGYFTYFLPGDFSGDGIVDQAVYTNVTNNWVYRNSDTGNNVYRGNYPSGWIPVPGDYDGDRRWEIAFFNPANGAWIVYRWDGGISVNVWGISGDTPIPTALTHY